MAFYYLYCFRKLMKPFCKACIIILMLISVKANGQQDVDFHLNAYLLQGKKILRVKRDYNDPYLWVLAANNEVYRINSLTLAIDDYTATFAGYNNLTFTDIAGRSQDTVFVATNSTNVLEYKKGVLRIIGPANGLSGTINQVGMDHIYTNLPSNIYEPLNGLKLLMIATTTNIYYYDCVHEAILSSNILPANNRLFEITYRTEAYSNLGLIDYYDPVKQFSTINRTPITIFGGALWYNTPEFGYHINTAYYITANYLPYQFGYDDSEYMNQLWGTENGLFQNNWDESYYLTSPYKHYLDGIKVNKITSIYGLTSFGSGLNPGLARENLLVGTDKGFYFSSSGYEKYSAGPLNIYNTFTFDSEIGNKIINDVCVNATSYASPVCEDAVWVAASDGLYLIKPDYAKYINNQKLTAISFQNLPDTVPAIQLCADSSVIATINSTKYTGNNIQWYKNGAELPGESTTTLHITTAGDYNAVLYDPCANIHIESNHLTVDTISAPSFVFNYPDLINQCDGSVITLKAKGSTTYQYRWYKNDTLTTTSTDSIAIRKNGKYKIEVSACPGAWVSSKEVQVNFIRLPVAVISVSKPAYCLGDQANLSINTASDPSYIINWLIDGTPIPGYQNLTTITTSVPGSYSVTITSRLLSNCIQLSATVPVIFNTPPALKVRQVINTTLCEGQSISLNANYSGGTIKWSTGETSDQIGVHQSGTYTATVTSPAGCVADTSISVQFLPNPVFSIPDTALCIFTRQTIKLIAPAGFEHYNWNNGMGTEQTFTVSIPQTVILTVTDTNGCTATQNIEIAAKCPDVHIPNTFTPNGDGVNDLWDIGGLENDPSAMIRVFNRYGLLVYESKGYATSWDGNYRNKKLPAGVYYYIINAKNDKQKFTGSVTIIY